MERCSDKESGVKRRLRIMSLLDENGKELNCKEDALILLLQSVQEELGFLPEEALLQIARLTRLPAATVFGTATFYSQFRLKPAGKYMVRVCRGTACHVRGGANILKQVEKQLGIHPGESSNDLKFALETVACIGACAQAPTVVVANEAYGKVTKNMLGKILKQRE